MGLNDPENQPGIIDLGLAQLKVTTRHGQQDDVASEASDHSSRASDHYSEVSGDPLSLTVTLPFVACELLWPRYEAYKHALHHDVESVFWVLLYICLKEGEKSLPPPAWPILRALSSDDSDRLKNEKLPCLLQYSMPLGEIGGRFGELGGFLGDFATHWARRGLSDSKEVTDVSEVRDMAAKRLDELNQKLKIKANPSTSQEPGPSNELEAAH